jgi:hypothetical protein
MFILVYHFIHIIHFENYVAGSQRRKCYLIFGRKTLSKDENYMKKLWENIIKMHIMQL